MLWVATFLLAGKFSIPSQGAYDSEVHLNLEDLAIDLYSVVRVRIERTPSVKEQMYT